MSFAAEIPMTEGRCSMAEKSAHTDPPAYMMQPNRSQSSLGRPLKTKLLFGYAVAVSAAFVVVLIIGGVYYFRSLDVMHDTIKTFHRTDRTGTAPVEQDIEVNTDKKTLLFHLQGEGIAPGTFVVLDYAKSMTGMYDPKARTCYLIAGIRSGIEDPKTFADELEKNVTKPTTTIEVLKYQLADSYPVSDKAILPAALKTACAYSPVYWLEPATGNKNIQKRGTYCFYVCVNGYCYIRCW